MWLQKVEMDDGISRKSTSPAPLLVGVDLGRMLYDDSLTVGMWHFRMFGPSLGKSITVSPLDG
jgi:hypothetical protein